MAKNRKLVDPSFKVIHYPLSQTLSIHSSTSATLKERFPDLVPFLSNMLQYGDLKVQKQSLKQILSLVQKIKDDEMASSALAELVIASYIDFGFTSIKYELSSLVKFLAAICANNLKVPEKRHGLLFNPDTPLSHVEYMFSRYLELMHQLNLEVPREEHSKILEFVITKYKAAQNQHIEGGAYNVASVACMATCLTFLSSYIPKHFTELSECDVVPMKILARSVNSLIKQQLLDRDILTLSGIVYWLAANSLVTKQIGPYPATVELKYLNTVISQGELNLDDITKQVLVDKVKSIEKSANTMCIVRGFLRVIKSLDNLYVPCIELGPNENMPGKECSYMDYILRCCETEQVNTRIYALITLSFILVKEAEIAECTRGADWAKHVLEVILGCLDTPHKGTVKAAEDCLNSLLRVLIRRSLKVAEVVLPLVHNIPKSLRKRKLLSLIHMIEYIGLEDLKQIEGYVKYALECILEDTATMRMASLCVHLILSKLKKASKSTEDWLSEWCEDFIGTLCSAGDKILILSNSMVNIVLAIDPKALPVLILNVLQALAKGYKTELLVVLLALLVEARRLRKLKYTETQLIVSDQVEITITPELNNILFNLSDTNAVLLALSLCVSNPKMSETPEAIDRVMFHKAVEAPSTNTYDDYREKHMKLCQKYLGDLKGRYHQFFAKATPENEKALSELKHSLMEIVHTTEKKLRIDVGYDMIYQPLSVLKGLWDSFSDAAAKWGLHSHVTALFAVNGLSSTWELQRTGAYSILEGYPVEVLKAEEWQHFANCALQGLCSPRSTEAEGAALFLKLLYSKHLRMEGFDIEWDATSKDYAATLPIDKTDLVKRQLRWVRIMLQRVKSKRARLNETLFKKASCEDLFHGELRFLNMAIQSMKIEQSESSSGEWKVLVDQILKELQEISDYCEGLLSSAGIIDEETGNIIVDCRGRLSQMNPEVKAEISKAKGSVKKEYYYAEDYENLLSTGIWLLAKESGNLYKKLAEWLIFPGFSLSSWLTPEEVKATAFNFLGKILSYKHRGAFLKLVEALQTIISKCVRSRSSELQAIPGIILEKVFAQIQGGTLEANKTLRRSAGIPHSILAVLRSEAYPVLLLGVSKKCSNVNLVLNHERKQRYKTYICSNSGGKDIIKS
eukprot:TRINITY_DN1877_c0_g1_i1.p1 TRINITY_DN1877_c0_g1~~TRINITY_DN1877_c0_g1_i1.p1  ORF type:complete len:1167 (-),score=87.25 TRINITY_DN1877_c0_g1_i1:8708-12124(-)